MSEEVWWLKNYGDPIEMEGVQRFGLGEKFSRYADFWAWYVLPNRSKTDPSKFRDDFPQELEALCNHHYGVWYQLVIAYRQLEKLDDELIDISDPLFHLGTAIDLIERTFLLAFRITGRIAEKDLSPPLTEETYREKAERFWTEEYSSRYADFLKKEKPVNLSLHSIGEVLETCMSGNAEFNAFKRATNAIRQYRNLLIHNLPPLKKKEGDIVHIPKPIHLHKYADARWSSQNTDSISNHYGPAGEIIRDLADTLVHAANDLWNVLLDRMDVIADSRQFSRKLEPFLVESGESGDIDRWTEPRKHRQSHQRRDASDQGYTPSSTPSGYKMYPPNDG